MAICGQPVKSRPGKTCTNLASRDVQGVKCCGKHISYLVHQKAIQRALDRGPPPPPPPPPPSFVPFDCGICMDECGSASASCKTICNHRFHKACLSKWELRTKYGGNVFTCPMCRKELQRTSTASTSTSQSDDERIRILMRNQLELLMESLRRAEDANQEDANQEDANVTLLARLENLISQNGVDVIASAVNQLISDSS